MRSQYIPGRGYTVTDARGRVIAHSLTRLKHDVLMSRANGCVITRELLAAVLGG